MTPQPFTTEDFAARMSRAARQAAEAECARLRAELENKNAG
jgi:hypothetical protein